MARPRKPVRITWLGEDHLHGGSGPAENVWGDITFPKGEPVEVADPKVIAKAKGNQFYSVEGHEAE